MSVTTLILVAVASFAATLTPGPTVLLALSNGATSGMRAARFGIAGTAAADLLLIAAVASGLGALLAASELAFSIVELIGVAYLCWLAVQLWRSNPQALRLAPGVPLSALRAFSRSLLVALSNPKALLFFSALLPQFVDTAQPQAAQYLTLAGLFISIDIVVMGAYALGGARAARAMTASGLRLLNRVCAGALLMLAALLAAYRKSAS